MEDIHDIQAPVQTGIDPLLIKAGLVFLGVLILGCLLFWLLRRFAGRKSPSSGHRLMLPPPPPPLEQAIEALDRLADMPFSDLREFYFAITAVLKRFIGRALEIRALEMTTQELNRVLAGCTLDHQLRQRLIDLMKASDHVKYAGHRPAQDMVQADLKKARQVVSIIWETLPKGDSSHV